MDFKSILNKFTSIEAPPKAVAAPKLEQAVQLNEDAQLRVLSGRTTYLAEAKKKKEEEIAEEMKVGDTKKTAKGGTVTKTSTGIKHTKKDTYDGEDHQEEPKKKASKTAMTGAQRQAQKAKDKEQSKASKEYAKKNPGSVKKYVDGKLVKEGTKPDFLDIDKDGDKKEPMKKAAKDTKVKEGAKPDFLDMDKDGDKKEPMKKAVADKKKGAAPKKGVNPFAKKKVDETLSFRKAMQIVKESQGDFQIDPLDKALWLWAERVGKNKFVESVQAQAFAAVTYEKMGGEWNLHKIIKE
jgi:hypothetical protein